MIKGLFKRIASTGVNVMVLIVSMAIFIAAFFALSSIARANKPQTVQVLFVSQNLGVGDILTADKLLQKTGYLDETTKAYFLAAEKDQILGGIITLPLRSGQPLLRSAVLARGSEAERLSAALADYPEQSLFPLPLDLPNIIAPGVASFVPGDLIGITLVMAGRPQDPRPTPTLSEVPLYLQPYGTAPYGASPTETPPAAAPTPTLSAEQQVEKEQQAYIERGYPPLAKDLFPAGVRVITVQGLSEEPGGEDSQNGLNDSGRTLPNPAMASRPMLLLLLPQKDRETLSLVLQQSDQIVISLLARGNGQPTQGFTYWDLENMIQTDRKNNRGDQ